MNAKAFCLCVFRFGLGCAGRQKRDEQSPDVVHHKALKVGCPCQQHRLDFSGRQVHKQRFQCLCNTQGATLQSQEAASLKALVCCLLQKRISAGRSCQPAVPSVL